MCRKTLGLCRPGEDAARLAELAQKPHGRGQEDGCPELTKERAHVSRIVGHQQSQLDKTERVLLDAAAMPLDPLRLESAVDRSLN